MILEEMKTLFLDNNYTEEYFRLVTVDFSGKGQEHHILPKSIWPEYIKDKWNLVNLSYAQHYRVHEILPFMVKTEEERLKMLQAWNFICGNTNGEFVSQEEYVKLREDYSAAMSVKMSGEGNHQFGKKGPLSVWYGKVGPNKGKTVSEETKQLLHVIHSTRERKPHSQETKDRIGVANSGENNYWYGKTTTDKQKAAARKISIERIRSDEEREKVSKFASIPVVVDGIEFKSQKDAADHLGVSASTIKNWIKSGRAIRPHEPNKKNRGGGGSGLKGVSSPSSKQVEIDGVIYFSQKEAAKRLNVVESTIGYWLSTGRAKRVAKVLDNQTEVMDNTQITNKEEPK